MTYDYARLAKIKCFLFDMDGTINLGNELIPGMEGFFAVERHRFLFIVVARRFRHLRIFQK